MENHNWSDIKGSASAPYINCCSPRRRGARQYYDNPPRNHPSEPNYIWLEAGDQPRLHDRRRPGAERTQLDRPTTSSTQLEDAAGISWKAYAEDITGTRRARSRRTGQLRAQAHARSSSSTDVIGSPPSPTAAHCIAHVVPVHGARHRPHGRHGRPLQLHHAEPVQRHARRDRLPADQRRSSRATPGSPPKSRRSWRRRPTRTAAPSSSRGTRAKRGELPIGMIVAVAARQGRRLPEHEDVLPLVLLRTVEEVFGLTPFLSDAANQADLSDLFKSFP